MIDNIADLRAEVNEALDRVWFVQRVEKVERTDITLSLRLHIRPGLFVQVFCGDRSGALYFALVEGDQRVFGIDRERGEWHIHPYGAVENHQVLTTGLEPKPLRTFLSRVEEVLLVHDLL